MSRPPGRQNTAVSSHDSHQASSSARKKAALLQPSTSAMSAAVSSVTGSTGPSSNSNWGAQPEKRFRFNTIEAKALQQTREMPDQAKPVEPANVCEKIVHSCVFKALVTLMIVVSEVTIGWKSEIVLKQAVDGGTNQHAAFEALEWTFTIFFCLELALRFSAEGPKDFLYAENRRWNIFDTTLVTLSVAHHVTASEWPAGRILQVVRLVRLTRLFRIIRVIQVMSQTFRTMANSIKASLSVLMWVFLILSLIMYSFTLVFMHGVTRHFEEHGGRDAELDALLLEHYGTVFDGVLSLFTAISGGNDWYYLLRPLLEVGGEYGALFIFYVYFTIFGALNVVTSVFVDSVYKLSLRSREISVQNEKEKNHIQVDRIKNFFREADVRDAGQISFEEFRDHLQDDECAAYFSSLGLDVSQASELFAVLDTDCSNALNMDEFITGCMKLKGEARSLDVNVLLIEQRKMMHTLEEFMPYVEQELTALRYGTACPEQLEDAELEASSN